MNIIAVVGTGSGSGKTTVACRLLKALPGLGAVKISPRDAAAGVEWGAGEPGKDTDCYSVAGAARVARIVGPRGAAAGVWAAMEASFRGLPGVVVEGAGSLELPGRKLVVLVVGATFRERSERNSKLASIADVIVINFPITVGNTPVVDDVLSHNRRSPVLTVGTLGVAGESEWEKLASFADRFLRSGRGAS